MQRREISIGGKWERWMQGGDWREDLREMSLIFSCLRLSNCSLPLATDSFSDAIFNSQFHLEASA